MHSKSGQAGGLCTAFASTSLKKKAWLTVASTFDEQCFVVYVS